MAGSPGTFVIAWSQTEIDGLGGAPLGAMRAGAVWSWTGDAIRIDGRSSVLTLLDPIGGKELRRRAARAAFRMLQRAQIQITDTAETEVDPCCIDTQFSITDGTRVFPAAIVAQTQAARPLLVFPDSLPPRDTELWVLHAPDPVRRGRGPAPTNVICFVSGTRLTTPEGSIPVEHLRAGQTLCTKDAGNQPILWVGTRTYSGARLHAMPHLRPVRVPNATFGSKEPDGDLLISPGHRLLIRGAAARALYNTPEVLVAARDLVGRRDIASDRRSRDVTYHHILLPRHEIVWANGMATESFHPDHADLSDMSAEARTALDRVLCSRIASPDYGPPARRMLSSAETEILLHEGSGRQALRQFA